MDLISCNIIEKDYNNDVLWAWIYPSITDNKKQLMLRKCSFDLAYPFLYGRFKNEWFYINSTEVFESDSLPGVKQFALVLWSRDFNPEKYETLCRVLSKSYCKTGNPAMLLKLFLSVVTRGVCTTEENGTYLTKDFELSAIQSNITMLKDLIKLFGLQTIIVYTALLLKKRLVIYHHSLPQLLKWVRTFPALMAHRPEAEYLYPWLDLHAEDLDQIVNRQSYVVGCGDSRVLSRENLFDVLINLPAQEITITPHAKESMVMTKTHKEIALFLVQLAERENITENQIVKEINEKTQELIKNLRSFASEDSNCEKNVVTIESIKSKRFSPAVENFLLQLGRAENIIV